MSSLFAPKGNPQKTTTTEQVLSPQQQELLDLAMPGVRKFAATTPQRYQGDTVADFTNPQVQGQQMALGAAGAQQGLANSGAASGNFWANGDVWNPQNNEMLQGAVNAAVRPITENFQEKVMPGIRGEAIQAGQQFGGSRRGVAEGIAAREYGRAVGDTASKVVNQNYQTNVDAQMKALGLIPQLQGAQVAPALTTSGVGDVQQGQQQREIDADVSGFNYDQMAPFLQSKEILSLLQGLPGGSVTSTATATQPQPSTAQMGMQIAGLGASLLPFFMS